MVTERGSSLVSSKDFKSIYSLHQIFCLNLMDTEAPKGMTSMSSECVDDLAGLPKKHLIQNGPNAGCTGSWLV